MTVLYRGKDTVFFTSQTGSMGLTGAGGGFNNGKTAAACRVTLTVWPGLCSSSTFRLA